MIFEMHLTFPLEMAGHVRKVAADNAAKWSFSAIDGDPVLGPGVKCYLTSSDDDFGRAIARTQSMTFHCTQKGFAPIREKIEMIVYDTQANAPQLPRGGQMNLNPRLGGDS